MKFKKSLVIIITILLCFTMYQKPKKVEAFDFVITPTVLWALGTIAVGTGVILVNKDQIMDLGSKIATAIDDWGQVIEDNKIKLNTYLFTKIVQVIVGLNANENKEIISYGSKSVSITSYGYDSTSYGFETPGLENAIKYNQNIKFDVIPNQKNTVSIGSEEFSLSAGVDTILIGQIKHPYQLQPHIFSLFAFVPKNASVVGSSSIVNYNIRRLSYSSSEYTSKSWLIGGRPFISSTVLPYGEARFKENFNSFPTSAMPFNNSQAIPIPQEIPVVGDITTEFPLTDENLEEKGGIVVIPNDNVAEHEGVIDDVPGTDIPEDLSLWGWLKALLMALLNFLKSIFDALKGFFTQIFDFWRDLFAQMIKFFTDIFANLFEVITNLVGLLVSAFTDMFASIFTVEEGYFISKFNGFKTDFLGKLGMGSYLDFLDYDFGSNSLKDITINWKGQQLVIVKVTLYEKFRSFVNNMVYAFMFFLLCVYNYNQVYKLIRGSDYASASHYSMMNSITSGMSNNKRLE